MLPGLGSRVPMNSAAPVICWGVDAEAAGDLRVALVGEVVEMLVDDAVLEAVLLL